jgi:hypothetical protein
MTKRTKVQIEIDNIFYDYVDRISKEVGILKQTIRDGSINTKNDYALRFNRLAEKLVAIEYRLAAIEKLIEPLIERKN